MATVYERWLFNPFMDRMLAGMPQILDFRSKVLQGTELPVAAAASSDSPEPASVVLEVGSGTGLNFPHYPAGLKKLYTLQPYAPSLVPQVAEQRAHDRGLEVEHLEYVTEQRAIEEGILPPRAEVDARPMGEYIFPFKTGSVDHLVCTFCLCTIPDHPKFLSEVCRVLRPGGSYRFIEHIDPQLQSDPTGKHASATWRGWRSLHKVLGCGCDIGNNTQESLKAAGWFDLSKAAVYGEAWPKDDPSREWWLGKLVYGVVHKHTADEQEHIEKTQQN